MKTPILLLPLLIAASAAAADGTPSDYGSPAGASSPGRSIWLDPGARHVNVDDGETVHFLVGDKRIDWNFNIRTREAVFDLQTIAPIGVEVNGVRVWVQPNPLYSQG